MDCPPGQKKVAVVERWPLVEVRLYTGSTVLLTTDMRILDKEKAVCRCMAFSIELLQLRGQCHKKYKFPNGK